MSDAQNPQSKSNEDKTSQRQKSGEQSLKKPAPENPPATPDNQRTNSMNFGQGKSDGEVEFWFQRRSLRVDVVVDVVVEERNPRSWSVTNDWPAHWTTGFARYRLCRHPCQQQISRVRTATAQAGDWPGIRPHHKQFPRQPCAKNRILPNSGLL